MVIAQMMIPRACSNWNFFLDPVTTSYQPARLRICQTHELETVVNVALISGDMVEVQLGNAVHHMQCYLTNPETGWVVKHVVAESHALM